MFVVVAFQTIAQQNISDVRKLSEGETVTITGIITNGNELGLIRYIQDTTAGLAIYDDKLDNTKRGDSITVTGEIDDYNNLFEIKNVSSLTVHTSGNKLPAPKILTIDEIGEDFEGQLVEINSIEIENANGTFDGGKNYNFTNNSETGIFRINIGSPIVGQVIPTGETDIISILSQYSFNSNDTRSGYQLLPRTMSDFVSRNSINFTSPLEISAITKNGFTLSWRTDVDASSEIFFRENSNQSSWTDFATGSSTQVDDEYFHEVEISGLEPATIIYAKAFSVLNVYTAFSSIGVFATESNSTGDIKMYFNTPVNSDVSTRQI